MGADDRGQVWQGGYRLIDALASDPARDRAELVAGLRAPCASIAPKYFYDELGCALYGAICRLPEYYPTRSELWLFEQYRGEIAAALPPGTQLVDLGSGDSFKAAGWLPHLVPRRYVAVDIARGEIERALAKLALDHPAIAMVGLVTDFSERLDLDAALDDGPATFFYPGSSIGNFTPTQAEAFLARIHAYCADRPGSSLLIGIDCRKEKAVLDAAYDDPLGVTAAFNRNVLLHVNRVLGSDFDIANFTHRGFFAEGEGRIEMHLEAIRAHDVAIDGVPRRFEAGERIHTENSYKYRVDEFAALLQRAGFSTSRHWMHPAARYAVFHAR